MNKYLITSKRNRSDEFENVFTTEKNLEIGDVVELDGIEWNIVKVIEKSETKPKKVWTEDEIRNLVQTNDKVLYGALKKLYEQQTTDEKETGLTSNKNGMGFNAFDSKILSSFAEGVMKYGRLTDKQKVVARKKMIKYTKQLTVLSNM